MPFSEKYTCNDHQMTIVIIAFLKDNEIACCATHHRGIQLPFTTSPVGRVEINRQKTLGLHKPKPRALVLKWEAVLLQ